MNRKQRLESGKEESEEGFGFFENLNLIDFRDDLKYK